MSQNPVDTASDAFGGRNLAGTAKLIYILYLVGIVLPVVPIVAVVLAYLYRADMTGFLASHNRYQIRTFWIALVYFLASSILTLLLIGWLLYVVTVVWLIVRCVKGLQAVSAGEPIRDPATWAF